MQTAERLPIDHYVEKYIALRDRKKEIVDEAKKRAAKYDEALEKLEALFLKHMERTGLTSLPTSAGTPYKQERTNCTVADGEAFLSFIIEQGEWDLLDRRASKTAVEAYKDAHGELPPGLNWKSEMVVNVRRS